MAQNKQNQGFTPVPVGAVPAEESKPAVESVAEEQKTEKTEKKETAKDGFKVPKGAENRYFCEISTKGGFDPNTGERIRKPFVISYTPNEFKQLEQTAEALGYEYKVLYKPE